MVQTCTFKKLDCDGSSAGGGTLPNPPSPNRIMQPCLFKSTLFWEVEGPQVRHLSESEKTCEGHFKGTTPRDKEGRYVVALSFNHRVKELGESKTAALKLFLSLERKLRRDEALGQDYAKVIQEYLGHLTEITDDYIPNEGYYLPHHAVFKNTSQTTKLRVVFDGSAATSSGISLNNTLHTGPTIQNDLLYILLRFRNH